MVRPAGLCFLGERIVMGRILVTLLIGLMLTVSGGIIRAEQFEDGVAAY